MTRKVYVWLFMAMAVAFVPVVFNFGIVTFLVPAAWGIAALIKGVLTLEWGFSLGCLVYLAVYLPIFYGMARLTFLICCLPPWRPVQITLQTVFLAGLLGFSFAEVITYGSIQGRGGTYTFWGAVGRFYDRQINR